jgi:hypothetical protein
MRRIKDTQYLIGFGGAAATFLLAPYLPTGLIDLIVGNRVSAFLVIAATAYVFKRNMLFGLALFLAFASLFLEYRRRKIDAVRISYGGAKGQGATLAEARKPAAPLVKGEVHPRFQVPSVEEHDYEPGNGDNAAPGHENDSYDGAVENEKGVLDTVSQPAEAAHLFTGKAVGLNLASPLL